MNWAKILVTGTFTGVLVSLFILANRWDQQSLKRQVVEFKVPLPLSSSQEFTSKFHLGEYILVHWAADWCEACHEELKLWKQVHSKLESLAVVTLGILTQDEWSDQKAKSVFTFSPDQIGRDEKGDLARALGVKELPTTFLLGPGNEILFWKRGALEEESMERLLKLIPKSVPRIKDIVKVQKSRHLVRFSEI
ncbi:MAG: TlpA family protein disulfide reductase [Bdellovibrionales bacterium]|nr:TlpA family protein disulfide reductase [Bdellovibrionales bacterium]